MTTATQEANGTRTVYDVRGMDCAECARSVATAVERLPGVTAANVNFGAGTLTVDADEHSTVDLTPRVLHAVEVAGYRAVSRDSEARIESGALLQERRAQLAVSAVGLWLVGAVVSVMLERYDLARFIYAAAVVAGAWTFGRAAWMALRHRRIDMNVLMSVAIVGAILLGDWAEAAAAAALFAIGNLAQSLTLDRTRNALSSLSKLSPSEAWRVRDGREELVAVEQLVPGDSIRVRPGERFPIDGMFIEGSTAVDESLITGESMPVGKQPGSAVFAGSLNGSGSVLIEATHTVAESTLAQMAELVDQARGGRVHFFFNDAASTEIYTPAVVVLAALL
ncbi:MAG: cation-translocating P-type ATPase, partial [Thermomicrobiales bacterium]|nr:cation-translocating P-type ATPase [Thermomicrobiales bacterium]